MAAGDILLDADGNVRLDADGNVMLDDGDGNDCCCEEACPPNNCTDPPVDSALLTISGSAVNTSGCINLFDGRYAKWEVGTSFDGTYCLECGVNWDGSGLTEGSWGVHVPATLYVYDDAACTNLVQTITDWIIYIWRDASLAWDGKIWSADFTQATRFDLLAYEPDTGVCSDFSVVADAGFLMTAGGTWDVTLNGC